MADFCSCGSLMLNGQCSNKNCSTGAAAKASKASGSRTKSSRAPGKRRTSKVVTYNLYEDSDREEDD